ncbi:hypothetical protein E4U44_005525 [Claviceps purpurea]|nr:hypothetical protein E4U44_005525 [Claviceps purpurea]
MDHTIFSNGDHPGIFRLDSPKSYHLLLRLQLMDWSSPNQHIFSVSCPSLSSSSQSYYGKLIAFVGPPVYEDAVESAMLGIVAFGQHDSSHNQKQRDLKPSSFKFQQSSSKYNGSSRPTTLRSCASASNYETATLSSRSPPRQNGSADGYCTHTFQHPPRLDHSRNVSMAAQYFLPSL